MVAHFETDSLFQMGSTHHVCEDYALAESKIDYAYAVVCDGCSSSRDTDVGVRIFAHTVRKLIPLYSGNFMSSLGCSDEELADNMQYVLQEAVEISDKLLADKQYYALAATVMILMVSATNYAMLSYGDGAFIKANQNGLQEFTQIAYDGNAPFYAIYRRNLMEEQNYLSQFTGRAVVSDTVQGVAKITEYPKTPCIIRRGPIGDTSMFVISSDGIESFRKDRSIAIAPKDIATKLTSIKSPNGAFLNRRVNKMKVELEQAGIDHYDDLGMAAVMVEQI